MLIVANKACNLLGVLFVKISQSVFVSVHVLNALARVGGDEVVLVHLQKSGVVQWVSVVVGLTWRGALDFRHFAEAGAAAVKGNYLRVVVDH
jgi:hypothetical protein